MRKLHVQLYDFENVHLRFKLILLRITRITVIAKCIVTGHFVTRHFYGLTSSLIFLLFSEDR